MADLNIRIAREFEHALAGPAELEALGAVIADSATEVAGALRLAGEEGVSAAVTMGTVADVPFELEAGSAEIAGTDDQLPANAAAGEITEAIMAAICTWRALLATATRHDDPAVVRLITLGAGVPTAPIPAGPVDRACEQLLAARTTPPLSVLLGHQSRAAAPELGARLDEVRQSALATWGLPVPLIPITVSRAVDEGRFRVLVLDTPYMMAVPEAGSGSGAVDAMARRVERILWSNLGALLTKQGVDLLLGTLTRSEPWLVSALDARYDRLDVTGILRELLRSTVPVTGLRAILTRLVGLTGAVEDATEWVAASEGCAYYLAAPGSEGQYRAMASRIGPFSGQYAGHTGDLIVAPPPAGAPVHDRPAASAQNRPLSAPKSCLELQRVDWTGNAASVSCVRCEMSGVQRMVLSCASDSCAARPGSLPPRTHRILLPHAGVRVRG